MAFGRGTIVYGGSLLLHAGVALALVRVEPEPLHEATSVTVVEVKKRKTEKAKPEPPPPPPVVQKTVPKVRKVPAPAPAPAPAPEAPAPVADAPSSSSATPPPMFGLTLSGGVGVGGGGIAVPQGNSLGGPQGPRVTRTAQPKALVAKNDRQGDVPSDTECLEALVKPKPIAIPQPTYADRAREAGVSGKVRVELTVDETGAVIETRVIEGLGYGLDEAALEAAKAARFEPALRCGKPTRTTFVIGIRFAL
jgi:periplasmic protein TonB